MSLEEYKCLRALPQSGEAPGELGLLLRSQVLPEALVEVPELLSP